MIVKYGDYDIIFCGKCKQKFADDCLFHCKYSFYEENNEEKINRILYGICKECFQVCTNSIKYLILCFIFYMIVTGVQFADFKIRILHFLK